MRVFRTAGFLAALLLPGTAAAAAAQTPAATPPAPLPATPAFHVTVGFAHLGWSDSRLSAATGPTLGVSRRVVGPVRIACDFASVSGNTFYGAGTDPAHHYLLEAGITVAPDLDLGGATIRPSVGAAIGSLVSDLARSGATTRSQNSWSLSAGLDVSLFGPFTLGAAYRHVKVRLQDASVAGVNVPSTPVGADLLSARIGLRF